ncbi:MAG: helix-turn-helix transcriptional regulator [Clostridia bacterium]|nr:helix-turn-helix transcriptional regulator [Clostridia bacterium]
MGTYERIKQLCDENGIKLSVLATGIGVRNSVFTELKMGRTKKLSVGTLEKIAAYFKVPLSYLTEEDESADSRQEELFRKRKLLFDLSAKASEEDLDKIIRIVDALTKQ